MVVEEGRVRMKERVYMDWVGFDEILIIRPSIISIVDCRETGVNTLRYKEHLRILSNVFMVDKFI